MKTKYYFLIITLLLISKCNYAQTFTDQTSINLTSVQFGSVAWGDYNNDGYLDILITGEHYPNFLSKIYKNNGNGTFTEQIGINLTGVGESSVAWGDYNNDGFLDILLTGYTSSSGSTGINPVSKIYKNNGNGTFTEQTGISLTGVGESSVAWGDYNNDGLLDILLTGNTGTGVVSKIYKNNGNGSFTEQTGISLTGIDQSSIAWFDYNKDGFLDILLSGRTGGTTGVSKIYKNNGDGSFTEQTGISLTGVYHSSVAMGDYNNDGYLDILLTGGNFTTTVSKIFKNNGDGTFTEQIGSNIIDVSGGSVVWGDYNNDGNFDILLTGMGTGTNFITKIYTNNGNETFSEKTGDTLYGVCRSSVAWGDYNNDGYLDILLTGYGLTGTLIYSKIYKNSYTITNNSPSIPQNLQYNSNLKKLSWNKSTDDHTPSSAITYNLAIGTASNPNKIKSAQSNLSTGFRYIAAMGNQQLDTFSIVNFIGSYDSVYFARVQAVDNAFKGSLYSLPVQFYVSPIGNIINNDTSITCGYSKQLDVNVNNGSLSGLSYIWTPSTGLSNPNIPNPIAKPIQTTWYKVNVTSQYGLSFKDSILITVNPMIVNAGTDVTKICGDSVTFNPTTTYPGNSSNLIWSWSPSNGLNSINIKTPKAKPNTTTNYEVNLISSDGCIATDTIKFTVNPMSVNAGSDVTKICGDSITFNPTTTYAGIVSNLSWSWSPANGLNSTNIKTPKAKPITTSNYIVSLSSIEGCIAKDTVKFWIIPLYVDAGIDTNLACGANINLLPLNNNYPSIQSNLNYQWSPANGLDSINKKTPKAQPYYTTTYYLNVSSTEGCQATDSVKVIVKPLTINMNNIMGTCGDSIIYGANINSNSTTIHYIWSPISGINNPYILNPYITPINNTTYFLHITDSVCSSIDTINVIVNTANFNPDFTVNQTLFSTPPFIIQCSNTTANLSLYNFTWNFGDDTILISNNLNVFHTYIYNGLYSLSLIATHINNSCQDTVIKTGYIYCAGGPNIGLNEYKENRLKIEVYPNPVSNELFIEMEGNKAKLDFEIFNSIGQQVYKGKIKDKTVIQTADFVPGVYLIKIKNGKTYQFKKIVKE